MTKLTRLLACIAAGALAACSGPAPRQGPPAPVVHGGGTAAPAVPPAARSGGEPEIAAYVPPSLPQTARPEPARAVQVLMTRAEDQRRAGQLGDAVVSLERALRIEPRDPVLWNRLAEVRAAQERYAMAEELAAKSNSLAALGDRALKRSNWEIIAASRRAQGKTAEAREAERRASAFD